jgi:hypothetical protein
MYLYFFQLELFFVSNNTIYQENPPMLETGGLWRSQQV